MSRARHESALERQIQQRIQSFVRDIEKLVREAALQAVSEALGARAVAGASRTPAKLGAPKRGRGSPSGPKSKTRGKRVRRTTDEIQATASSIYDYVSKNPGQGAEQIKKALGLSQQQWLVPVRKLVDEGRIKASGAKRSTTYAPK